MIRRNRIVLGIASLGLAVGLGYAIRARASGIPAANALSYAGILEDASGPITGSHNIQVILYDAATAGNNLCQSATAAVSITDGHYSVQLPDACTTAVGANPNAWVDVLVDGSDTGRTKIGAVPYAVEANHAMNATNVTGPQAQQIVPSGAVMFFNLTACPAGWSALAAAQGRYIVGLDIGGTLASTVGTALSDQENRTVGQHTHSITDPGHNHGGATGGVAGFSGTDGARDYNTMGTGSYSGFQYINQPNAGNFFSQHGHTIASGATGVTVANAGTVAGTSAPYVQLLACQKN